MGDVIDFGEKVDEEVAERVLQILFAAFSPM